MELYKTVEGIYLEELPTTNSLLVETISLGKLIKEIYLYDERITVISQRDNLSCIVVNNENIVLKDNKDYITVYRQRKDIRSLYYAEIKKGKVEALNNTVSYQIQSSKLDTYKEIINILDLDIRQQRIESLYNKQLEGLYTVPTISISTNLCYEIFLHGETNVPS